MKYLALSHPSPKTSLDRNASTCSQEALARLQQRGKLRICAGFGLSEPEGISSGERRFGSPERSGEIPYHTSPLSIARLRVLEYTSPESSAELIHTVDPSTSPTPILGSLVLTANEKN
jgi:hypothetical protein